MDRSPSTDGATARELTRLRTTESRATARPSFQKIELFAQDVLEHLTLGVRHMRPTVVAALLYWGQARGTRLGTASSSKRRRLLELKRSEA